MKEEINSRRPEEGFNVARVAVCAVIVLVYDCNKHWTVTVGWKEGHLQLVKVLVILQ